MLLELENPGPQGKLGFPDFPPITKIDGVNFGSHRYRSTLSQDQQATVEVLDLDNR